MPTRNQRFPCLRFSRGRPNGNFLGSSRPKSARRAIVCGRTLRRGLAAAGLLVFASAAQAETPPRFVDHTAAQPFAHVYGGGWEHFVGGGVAVFDCNDDRLPDFLVAGGENRARLLVNRTGGPGAALAFDERTGPALTGTIGAYPLDIDGDGVLDLAVLRVGENVLLKGHGACRFTRANGAWSFDGGGAWTTAFSATWEAETWPTLAFGNYVDRAREDGPFEACDANRLYRPVGQGYGPPTALVPGYCALSMLFSDWRRAGARDLRITNDRHYYVHGGAEQLWRIDGTARPYRAEDGWQTLGIWGMGIASRDLTGDGLPEVFLTSMGDQKLRQLADDAAGPTYRDTAYARGVTATVPYTGGDGRPSSGWHAAFGDVDNDGLDDLFIAKGNVEQMPDAAIADPNNLLMQQPDGRFVERGGEAGLASVARGRGAALVDLNRDGRLDIVVVNRGAPLELYENATPGTGAWLAVGLAQAGANRRAVGAWIEVADGTRTWHREVTVGGGHAGGAAVPAHFGLGAARAVTVRVVWPDGTATGPFETKLNRAVLIDRAAGLVDR